MKGLGHSLEVGFPRVLLPPIPPLAPHTCWVDEALEDEDITINLVGGGEG